MAIFDDHMLLKVCIKMANSREQMPKNGYFGAKMAPKWHELE